MKQFIDILVSAIALICLLPVLCVIAIMIAVTMGRPVLFRQKRLGKDEQIFTILKFRSMRNAAETDEVMLANQARVTPVGMFIRRTSLDELPQLWNVLKGDMSLVGPRPLFIEYQPFYTERERLRHTVRPGITGLAQVSGRNMISWDKRLQLDVKYVENLSLWLDIKILLLTLKKALKRCDIITVPGVAQVPLNIYRGYSGECGDVGEKHGQDHR